MADEIEVRAVMVRAVEAPIAEALCEEFLEWMEAEAGWISQPQPGQADERSYADMARDFVATRRG